MSGIANTRNSWDQPFASGSVWNLGIGSSARWGRNSDTDVNQLRKLHGAINAGVWGQPIYIGTASDPLVTIHLTDGQFRVPDQQVHVPKGAAPASGGDRHMSFFDKTNPNKIWSYFSCTFNNGHDVAGGITASLGGVWDATGSGIDNSTALSDYDFAAGVINDYDLANRAINHAIRIAISRDALRGGGAWDTNIPWPNTHEDYDGPGTYIGNISYGSTIVIPSNVDLNSLGLSQGGMMIARALQLYGAIIRDSAGANQLTLYSTPESETNPLIQQMRSDLGKLIPHLDILRNQGPNSVNGGGSSLAPAALPLSTGQVSPVPAPDPFSDHTLVLNLSEDRWMGDAKFIATANGVQLGPEQSVTALFSQAESEAFAYSGDWGQPAKPMDIGIQFTNDAWGGTDSTDRNLHVVSITYDGRTVTENTALYRDETRHFFV